MKDPTMDFPGTVYNFTDDPGRNKILSILNLNISYEISNKDFIIYLYNVRYDAGYIHSTHIQVADSRLQWFTEESVRYLHNYSSNYIHYIRNSPGTNLPNVLASIG